MNLYSILNTVPFFTNVNIDRQWHSDWRTVWKKAMLSGFNTRQGKSVPEIALRSKNPNPPFLSQHREITYRTISNSIVCYNSPFRQKHAKIFTNVSVSDSICEVTNEGKSLQSEEFEGKSLQVSEIVQTGD